MRVATLATLLLIAWTGASAAGAANLAGAEPDAAAPSAAPLALLRPITLPQSAKADGAPPDPAVLRRRPVAVEAAPFLPREGSPPKGALRVELSLFEDAVFTSTFTPRASETLPYLTWRGTLDGYEGSQVVLVARGGRIAASVQTLDRIFQIVGTATPGVHEVDEIDPRAQLRESGPLSPEPPEAAQEGVEAEAPAWELRESWEKDEPTSFDVLGAYTSEAVAENGDAANIQNLIALGIEQLNTAFERSAIDLRARLVQTVELAYQSGELGLDLTRLRRKGDGFLDQIHPLRDSLKADVVALVRKRVGTGFCGMGYIMNGANNRAFEASAFSVTAVNCVVLGFTLAHEIGHNLGCNHALEDPTGTGAFPYSYAFKDIGGPFRTLMAYNCFSDVCPPVLNFSNPEVVLDGRVTGTARENNALSIQNVRGIVANFRVASAPSGGTCNPKPGPFAACQGNACSVCALKIADYPRYLQNHPGCNLNAACQGRKYLRCSRTCPAPTRADR